MKNTMNHAQSNTNMAERSIYADKRPQDAVKSFLQKHYLIMAAAIGVAIGCTALAYSIGLRVMAVVVYIVALAGVAYMSFTLNRLNFAQFCNILFTDCNAQKMLEATSLLMNKRVRARETPVYEMLYALCCTQLGYDDIAHQWVAKAETSGHLSVSSKLLACNIRFLRTVHGKNYDALPYIRGQIDALRSLTRTRHMRTQADVMLACIDFYTALNDKNWKRCQEMLGVLDILGTTRLQKVGTQYYQAVLAEAQGDSQCAREYYTFVATNGADCFMAAQSRQILSDDTGTGKNNQ